MVTGNKDERTHAHACRSTPLLIQTRQLGCLLACQAVVLAVPIKEQGNRWCRKRRDPIRELAVVVHSTYLCSAVLQKVRAYEFWSTYLTNAGAGAIICSKLTRHSAARCTQCDAQTLANITGEHACRQQIGTVRSGYRIITPTAAGPHAHHKLHQDLRPAGAHAVALPHARCHISPASRLQKAIIMMSCAPWLGRRTGGPLPAAMLCRPRARQEALQQHCESNVPVKAVGPEATACARLHHQQAHVLCGTQAGASGAKLQ